jgi:hypothetical protein
VESQRNNDQQLNLSNPSSVETVEDVEDVELPNQKAVMTRKPRFTRAGVTGLRRFQRITRRQRRSWNLTQQGTVHIRSLFGSELSRRSGDAMSP